MSEAHSSQRPWDQQLAHWLMRPLVASAITPNHITAFGMICGLAAVASYASGVAALGHLGGVLFMVAMLMDHADGELARLSGKSSRFGHIFDRGVAAANHTLIFVGIGWGQGESWLGDFAAPAGIAAGLAVSLTFYLRARRENRIGKSAVEQPRFAGFEIEDITYLIGPITWFGGLTGFLLAAGIGAPLFLAYTVAEGLWRFRGTGTPGA
jgi:phosphatidylglycerophosphate synthase